MYKRQGLGILGAVCIYVLIGILSSFGPIRAANLFYPEFTQSQRVQIGGFLEFGEFLFLYQTVAGFLDVYKRQSVYPIVSKNECCFFKFASI